MLPKEYFGSFDMVLVDLSETVMSMTVTKDLDIMVRCLLYVTLILETTSDHSAKMNDRLRFLY